MNLLLQGLANLPNELIILIFDNIQKITDKRQFLKTCIHYNNLTKNLMQNYECKYSIPTFGQQKEHCMEKFILELCQDKYFDLIPDYYIAPNNKILVACLSYHNCTSLLDIAKSRGCNLNNSINFGAQGGHISVIEWCRKNGKISEYFAGTSAVIGGQLEMVKYLNETDVNFNKPASWLCTFAAEEGQLEILKYAHSIGSILDKFTYYAALRNGNEEIINWLVENGCPID